MDRQLVLKEPHLNVGSNSGVRDPPLAVITRLIIEEVDQGIKVSAVEHLPLKHIVVSRQVPVIEPCLSAVFVLNNSRIPRRLKADRCLLSGRCPKEASAGFL